MSILVKYTPSKPLTREVVDAVKQEVIKNLSVNVQMKAAYIFGSVATNTFTETSDIDLIIVANTNKKFIERALEYESILNLFAEIDLLVYTPEEFEKLTTPAISSFWRSVTLSMQRIL